MNYINFVIITSTPGMLRDFLINRGILQEVEISEGIYLTGILPGMEWIQMPNPIMTNPGSGEIPPTYDTRNVYLVKFAHESVEDQLADVINEGDTIYDWTKFGRWIKANGAWQDAPAGWTVYGEPAGRAWKITGQDIWLVRDAPERFGMWQ